MRTIRLSGYTYKALKAAVAAIALTALVLPLPAQASGLSSARSVAMGGAHIGLAKGVDAAKYNPANLGLSGYRRTGLQFAGVGANIANNTFTLGDYNLYTGAFLTDGDKQDILDKIPDEGLRLSADVEATALAFSTGPFVLATTGVGAAAINLNKDILDLVLNGNTLADTITVTGSYSDAVGYATAGLSWGTTIRKIGNKELAVGATLKYVRGLGLERVVDVEGSATTREFGYAGEGRLIARTASGGKGYALDLGTALKLSKDYTVGLSVTNILSSISWNKNTQEHGYIFSFDTMTIENSGNHDLVVSDDYSEDIPSFSTSLPAVMRLGFAKTSGNLVWALDYVQGFRKAAAGASTKPGLSLGAEWSALKMLPLRAGFSAGENKSTAFSFGTGLNLFAFYLDAAAVVGSPFSGYSSKGLNLAVSTGLNF